jgi:hypothetical protein
MKGLLMNLFRLVGMFFRGLPFLGLMAALLGSDASAQVSRAKGTPDARVKKTGADALGYTALFEEEIQKIGQISPQEFAKRYASRAEYLGKLTRDPTTAQFWNEVNLDPKNFQPKKQGAALGSPYDFQLGAKEIELFKKNGFVVSARMSEQDFAGLFYRIYSRDLPVFISADALLHAWHRSYDAILEEIEASFLNQSLAEILAGMAQEVPAVERRCRAGVLAESVTDADYFLAVARSFVAGAPVPTALNQDQRVAATLKACDAQQLEDFPLFGRERTMDFSQFKPRGHYENSELLKRYFRAMMWCGRIDLRVAGNPKESSPRELGAAIVLHDLLLRSGKFEQWQQFDRILQTFVGRTDSMTFAQLGGVLAKANIPSAGAVKDLKTLTAVQNDIVAGKIGVQHIRSHYYESPPFGFEKVELPHSFTILGQKFALDSWVTAKVVFDDIIWDDNKVKRRIPSCLDVAFATFGNDQVVPELTARMTNTSGRDFRDGLNYQHNLAAVRNVIDAQTEGSWDANLYTSWLACLRELSKPTTGIQYPEVMRTRAWAMKTLNTQMASWTQLRHDTILYVKQSYTAVPACFYPAGYVEPIPHFWERFEKMATRAAELIAKTPYPDFLAERQVFTGYKDRTPQYKIEWDRRPGKDLQTKQATFLRNFAKQLAILREIAHKELAQKELTKEETLFLQEVVQLTRHGSGMARHGGWYPGLYYKGREDSMQWDAIVADVHTDLPDPMNGDPGCVLHQGVGNVDLLVVAVDNGKDRMVYLGPVLSHYEFEMPVVERKSDREWRQALREGKLPPRPEWTQSYLVPGKNEQAKHYYNANDR